MLNRVLPLLIKKWIDIKDDVLPYLEMNDKYNIDKSIKRKRPNIGLFLFL